jgi:hypothetical protein
LVLERVHGSDLYKHSNVCLDTVKTTFKRIVEAVAYLHE